jgi:hypothetical protein
MYPTVQVLSSAKSMLPDMRRPEGIRFEVCALIRLHGDAQGFGADRAAPSWHSVRATRHSGTKRSKARARFSIAWSLPAAISSVPADTHQLSRCRRAHAADREGLDLSAMFRLDRPRAGILRRELACSTTYQ